MELSALQRLCSVNKIATAMSVRCEQNKHCNSLYKKRIINKYCNIYATQETGIESI